MVSPRWRRVLTVARVAAVGGALFVGVVGVAHTKAGRPLLAYLPGMGGCPIGADKDLSPAERDRLRGVALSEVRGDQASPSRTAFGLVLGTSMRADVDAWARENGAACSERAGRNQLLCGSMTGASATGSADDVRLTFDRDGRLVMLDVMRRAPAASEAAALFEARTGSIDAVFGDPTKRTAGDASDTLSRGPLSSVEAEHRFRDLRVRVEATNLGHGRFVVREHYTAIEPG